MIGRSRVFSSCGCVSLNMFMLVMFFSSWMVIETLSNGWGVTLALLGDHVERLSFLSIWQRFSK